MKYDPYRHHRQSIRLDGHDYAGNNTYFVTICVWGKNLLLGEIKDGKTILNQYGEAVRQTWEDLPNHNVGVMLDAYEIMPDHFHGIIMISNPQGSMQRSSLPETVRQFKTFSAKRINERRNTKGVPVWQRNYHEHILRSEELDIFRKYIKANPVKKETYWSEIIAKYPCLKEMYHFDTGE